MSAPQQKTVIIIAGPTAVGKTAVAVQMAKHFDTAIISADSRQCYKELSIGVARPSEEELNAVPHYFIASHSITENVTAASFEEYALQKTAEIFKQKDTLIMTGGTGLYLRAFCEGLDNIPGIDETIRANIIQQYNANGLAWLQEEIKSKDPSFYASGEIQNPQRMMRALEVVESTGQSITTFRKGEKAERSFAIKKIGLNLPREELHRNINQRVDNMMREGLLDEVRSLLSFKHLNALQTVGYEELFRHLEGQCTLEQAIEEIKIHTKQYAKRQLTWFRRDKEMKWYQPKEVELMMYDV